MAGRKKVKGYVVQRVGWEYNDERYYRWDGGNSPVQVFLDRARAEAHCRALELKHGRGSLMRCIDVLGTEPDSWSSLPEQEIVPALRAAGVDPDPEHFQDLMEMYGMEGADPADDRAFLDWFSFAVTEEGYRWPEEVQEAVWGIFDRLRHYVVEETEVELEE